MNINPLNMQFIPGAGTISSGMQQGAGALTAQQQLIAQQLQNQKLQAQVPYAGPLAASQAALNMANAGLAGGNLEVLRKGLDLLNQYSGSPQQGNNAAQQNGQPQNYPQPSGATVTSQPGFNQQPSPGMVGNNLPGLNPGQYDQLRKNLQQIGGLNNSQQQQSQQPQDNYDPTPPPGVSDIVNRMKQYKSNSDLAQNKGFVMGTSLTGHPEIVSQFKSAPADVQAQIPIDNKMRDQAQNDATAANKILAITSQYRQALGQMDPKWFNAPPSIRGQFPGYLGNMKFMQNLSSQLSSLVPQLLTSQHLFKGEADRMSGAFADPNQPYLAITKDLDANENLANRGLTNYRHQNTYMNANGTGAGYEPYGSNPQDGATPIDTSPKPSFPGYARVKDPSGRIAHIPQSRLSDALKAGWSQ